MKNETKIINRNEFIENYKELFNDLFCINKDWDSNNNLRIFQNTEWNKILLPEGFISFEDKDISALEYAINKKTIISEIETEERFKYTCLFSFSKENLNKIKYQECTWLAHLQSVMFGKSKNWAIANFDEFSVLAGNQDFSNRFINKAGGITQIKKRWYNYCGDWFPGNLREKLEKYVDW